MNNTCNMRWVHWSIILWQFAWLNVVLPGHTRGSITVPGSTSSSCCSIEQEMPGKTPEPAVPACCAMKSGMGGHGADADGTASPEHLNPDQATSSNQKPAPPTNEQKRNCVFCKIVHGYTLPPADRFYIELTGSSEIVTQAILAQVRVIPFDFPFYPVGPPAGQSC